MTNCIFFIPVKVICFNRNATGYIKVTAKRHKNYRVDMQHLSTLLCSPNPATYPYPRPAKAISHFHIIFGIPCKDAVLQIGRSLVRFQMVLMEFFIDVILRIELWPWGRLNLKKK